MQQHTYTKQFSMTQEEAADDLILKLTQVGTVGSAYINGNWIGYMDNIYRTYYLAVPKQHLITGVNTLKIDIESTVRHSYANSANYTKDLFEDFPWTNVWVTRSPKSP